MDLWGFLTSPSPQQIRLGEGPRTGKKLPSFSKKNISERNISIYIYIYLFPERILRSWTKHKNKYTFLVLNPPTNCSFARHLVGKMAILCSFKTITTLTSQLKTHISWVSSLPGIFWHACHKMGPYDRYKWSQRTPKKKAENIRGAHLP